MSNLLNFFFSFDKLMKEKLVIAFFWLGIINIALLFFAGALSAIHLGPLAGIVKFFLFFVKFVLAIVCLRLVAEVCVAIFRINNNLSPDGGKSETADIDPIEEALKATESAAKRARNLSKSARERTTASKPSKAKTEAPKAAAKSTAKPAAKKAATATKTKPKAPSKPKAAPKPKTTTKPKTTAKPKASSGSSPRLKKDGTPAKRPGPKSKS